MSESILILKNISKSYHQANNSLSILKECFLKKSLQIVLFLSVTICSP